MLLRIVHRAPGHTRDQHDRGFDLLGQRNTLQSMFGLKHYKTARKEFVEIHGFKTVLAGKSQALQDMIIGEVVGCRVVKMRERQLSQRESGFNECR